MSRRARKAKDAATPTRAAPGAPLGAGWKVSASAAPIRPLHAPAPTSPASSAVPPASSSPTPQTPSTSSLPEDRPPPPATSAPSSASSPTPGVTWAPPEGTPATSAAHNAYAEQWRAHHQHQWRAAKEVPAGDTQLVHAWAYALTLYPATALTVWMQRTEPAKGAYTFYLDGVALVGEDPARRIYDAVEANRREPGVAETFIGRIRARHPTTMEWIEMMGGELKLPSRAQQQTNAAGAPPGWSAPGWGAPPPPYGAPWGAGMPPGPWGGSPPGYGYGGGAMPPWWMMPPPWMAQQQAAPPANIAADPEKLAVWQIVRDVLSAERSSSAGSTQRDELLSTLVLKLVEKSNAPAPAASTTGSPADAITMFGKMAEALDRIRGTGAGDEPKPGIVVHDVGGAKIIQDKNGDVDAVASALVSLVPEAKTVLKERAAKRAADQATRAAGAAGAAGTSGSQAPLRPVNGAGDK